MTEKRPQKAPENTLSILGKCQADLLQSRITLSGLSALFKNMGDCEFSSDELHGIGLSLDRIADQMESSLSDLSLITPATKN